MSTTRKFLLSALLAAAFSAACTAEPPRNGIPNAQVGTTIYRVEVLRMFWRTETTWWSTTLETCSQAEAQLEYMYLWFALQDGSIEDVLGTDGDSTVILDVRLTQETHYPEVSLPDREFEEISTTNGTTARQPEQRLPRKNPTRRPRGE